MPTVIYRGIWKPVDVYEAGDSVTRDGSMWVAERSVKLGTPGDEDSGWRLAVKRGRDGKDGRDGARGEKGEQGAPGRDLTQVGLDGSKW
jgi:integrin beta 3